MNRSAPASAPWRLAIADDHAIVRMGYRRLLEDESDLQVVAEYGDAESAWNDLSTRAPGEVQVLILDLSMPGRSGLDLLKPLREAQPDLKVLIFTMHDTEALRAQCIRAGAAAFVGKGSDPECLLQAVRQVVRSLDGPPTSRAPIRASATPEGSALHHQLTPREHQALLHLLAGCPLDRVAQTMGVSDKTVSNYQTAIRQKLGVSGAVELIRYGQAHGLMP